MVAQTILLPNVRKFFIPDPGMIIAEADLAGADAQVVAWEADDEELKSAFRAGLKVHEENAKIMYGELPTDILHRKKIIYDNKTAVHATNYGSTAKGLAYRLNWSTTEAGKFQQRWFQRHPRIKLWQERIQQDLHVSRSVRNKFGFRMVYFDRPENLLTKALAWGPQSTIAHTCQLGAMQLEENVPWVQILMQVHDSLVFQFPKHKKNELSTIKKHLSVTIPYDDPLTIPWTLKLSEKSWGHAEPTPW